MVQALQDEVADWKKHNLRLVDANVKLHARAAALERLLRVFKNSTVVNMFFPDYFMKELDEVLNER